MGAVKYHAVNARRQIVIPAKLRDRLAIKKGTKVAFVEEKGRLYFSPSPTLSLKACAAAYVECLAEMTSKKDFLSETGFHQ
jgi:AbrB family looped-hinge helix DNA binding protein